MPHLHVRREVVMIAPALFTACAGAFVMLAMPARFDPSALVTAPMTTTPPPRPTAPPPPPAAPSKPPPARTSRFSGPIPADAQRVIHGLRFHGVEVLVAGTDIGVWGGVSAEECRFSLVVARTQRGSLQLLLADRNAKGSTVIDGFEIPPARELHVRTLSTDETVVRAGDHAKEVPPSEQLVYAEAAGHHVAWRLACDAQNPTPSVRIVDAARWYAGTGPAWLEATHEILFRDEFRVNGRWPVDSFGCDPKTRYWGIDIDSTSPTCIGYFIGYVDSLAPQDDDAPPTTDKLDAVGCRGRLRVWDGDNRGSFDVQIAADRFGHVSGRGTFTKPGCTSDAIVSGMARLEPFPSD